MSDCVFRNDAQLAVPVIVNLVVWKICVWLLVVRNKSFVYPECSIPQSVLISRVKKPLTVILLVCRSPENTTVVH